MVGNEELSRMRWAARRGMLELDLVLEPIRLIWSAQEDVVSINAKREAEHEAIVAHAWIEIGGEALEDASGYAAFEFPGQ